MKRLTVVTLVLALGLLIFAVVALAYDGGWYSKWRGATPLTICVNGVGNLPAAEQVTFRAAMARWTTDAAAAGAGIGYAESGHCDGKISVRVGDGGGQSGYCPAACFDPSFQNYVLHGGTMWINPVIFTGQDNTFSYCHEQGHGLGLLEGYGGPDPDPSDCMAGTSSYPGQTSLYWLAQMYPVA
jgi:hypothetical protein